MGGIPSDYTQARFTVSDLDPLDVRDLPAFTAENYTAPPDLKICDFLKPNDCGNLEGGTWSLSQHLKFPKNHDSSIQNELIFKQTAS